MIQIPWVVGGIIIGMLISTVIVPPTRKQPTLPQPHDASVYTTDTGCVRFEGIEVPCTADTDSLNLLASK
jgi:hypothetical protein